MFSILVCFIYMQSTFLRILKICFFPFVLQKFPKISKFWFACKSRKSVGGAKITIFRNRNKCWDYLYLDWCSFFVGLCLPRCYYNLLFVITLQLWFVIICEVFFFFWFCRKCILGEWLFCVCNNIRLKLHCWNFGMVYCAIY